MDADGADILFEGDEWDLLMRELNHSLIHRGPDPLQVTDTTVGSCIVFLGVTLNLMLTIAAFKCKEMPKMIRNVTLSLVAADCTHLIIGVINEITMINGVHLNLGRFGCRIFYLIPEISRISWMGSLMVYAWSKRFESNTNPALINAVTPMVWMIALVFTTPFAMRITCHELLLVDISCYCAFDDHWASIWLYSSSIALCVAVPIAIIVVALVRSSSDGIDSNQHPSSRFLVSMALSFMVTTLPLYIFLVVLLRLNVDQDTFNYDESLAVISMAIRNLFNLSTFIHPLMSPHLRLMIRQLVQHIHPRQQHQQQSDTRLIRLSSISSE